MCAHGHADIYTVYTHTPAWPLSWHGFRPTCLTNWVNWRVKMSSFRLWKLLVSKLLATRHSFYTALTLLSRLAFTVIDAHNHSHVHSKSNGVWCNCVYVGYENVNQSKTVTRCICALCILILALQFPRMSVARERVYECWRFLTHSRCVHICSGWRNESIARKQNVMSEMCKKNRPNISHDKPWILTTQTPILHVKLTRK